MEDNARLCGRAWGKIFYSNNSFIQITLALNYAKYDTVLSFVYQVHSNRRILFAEFQEKMSGLVYNVQQLFVMTDNSRMDIYYYNTYIWNKLSVIMHKNKYSGNRALVYDGPNSRSKLLGDLQTFHDGRDTFTSSLSIISIYLLTPPPPPPPPPFPACFNISVYTAKQKATFQTHVFKTKLNLNYG